MKPVCLSAEARPFRKGGRTFYNCRAVRIPGGLRSLPAAGVQLGCLICVDTDGHLEKIPAQTWELVERILAKQLFVEASRQDKPFETAEDILMHLLDGGFSSAAYFSFRPPIPTLRTSTRGPSHWVDLTAYRSVYAGKRRLKEALEARLPDSHPFLYKGDVFLFLHEDEGAQAFDALAEEFHLKVLISEPLDELFDLPKLYPTAREALELMRDERFHGERVCSAAQRRIPLLLKNLEGAAV